MVFSFWMSFLIMLYVYGGYLIVLKLICYLFPSTKREIKFFRSEELPSITVMVAAFNEDMVIKSRIDNILESDYPDGKIKILIVSDGSTDQTDNIVNSYGDDRVSLFRVEDRKGKTNAQNQAMEKISNDFVVFTDADSRFDPFCLKNLVGYFIDEKVGVVAGKLIFEAVVGSGISHSQGNYWSYELKLRELESQLGILAIISGGCFAIRKNCFRKMDISYGDDCIIPLDAVRDGFDVVHAKDAVTYDYMAHEANQEFKARVRMTLRNWQCTWAFKDILNPILNPRYAFALWSHKILRWLSPVFLIILTLCNLMLISDGVVYAISAVFLFVFYCLGFVGYLGYTWSRNVPGSTTVFSFLLANVGFFLGILEAIKGKKITVYRN